MYPAARGLQPIEKPVCTAGEGYALVVIATPLPRQMDKLIFDRIASIFGGVGVTPAGPT